MGLEGLKFCLRLDMEYAERIHNLYRDHEQAVASQASLARVIAHLSPAWDYYQAVSSLAGTDAGSFLRFLDQARRYRRDLIQYVQNKGGLFSAAYFTRANVAKLPITQDLEAVKTAHGQHAVDEMIGPGWPGVRPLDLRDIPNWDFAPASLGVRIAPALPEAGILLFLNLVLFLAVHVVLLRTDVRAG